jgi:hypothetical protein
MEGGWVKAALSSRVLLIPKSVAGIRMDSSRFSLVLEALKERLKGDAGSEALLAGGKR